MSKDLQPSAEELQILTGLTSEFIGLANQMKNDKGFKPEMINAALIAASATYSTYMTAGNDGYLKDSGVDKVMAVYKRILDNIQAAKKAEVEAKEKAAKES